MSKNVRKRRDKLWIEKNGKCYWCGINTIIPPRRMPKNAYVANLATLDHLRSRLDTDRQEPNYTNEERTVLSCLVCNQVRGKIYQMLTQDVTIVYRSTLTIREADNMKNEDQSHIS